MRRFLPGCLELAQLGLSPVVLYEQAETENTGSEPALGSPRVPLKDPAELKVPASSIADPEVAVRVRGGVATPLLRFMNPVAVPATPAVCQVLLVLTVPSVSTFNCAVSTWPSGSDPLPQVLAGCRVNAQLPDTWAAVTPVAPKPMNGSVLVSQALRETSNVRQRTMDLT
jgi:hypothetical protein